jgi:cytochrome c oxidase assembly protein subunit 15
VKSPAPRRLAVLVALLTLPLIFMGGRVTSTGSGMAVPDWPTTFGENMFFFPWSKWVGPVLIEHTHRLAAAIVGLATIALAILMAAKVKSPRVRWLGFVALLLVIGQGVLGGMRVVLYEHGLAPIHGCIAQAFFAFVMALVALTSRGSEELATVEGPRTLAVAAAGSAYVQVALGAWYRHTAGARLEPHAIFALVILAHSIALARSCRKDPVLRSWARLLHGALGLQILLGVASWWFKGANVPSDLKVAIVSTHLVFGALVLGTTVAIAVLSFRSVEKAEKKAPDRELVEVGR